MAFDGGGEGQGAHGNGAGAPAGQNGDNQGAATDDLRARMRMRMATQVGSRQADPPPAPRPIQLSPQSHTEVGPMVWNSVLDSLSAAATPASTAMPTSLASPLASGQPATVTDSGLGHIFAPVAAATPAAVDFATLIPDVAAAPAVLPQIVPAEQPAAVAVQAMATATTATATVTGAAPTTVVEAGQFDVIVPAVPTLAPPTRVAPPRPGQSRFADEPEEEAPVPAKAKGKRAAPVRPLAAAPRKKKERHPFRTFFAFLLIVAILGGAGYAGWYYILRNKVQWSDDLKPMATFVETTLDSEFTATVPVKTLSAPEYEVKLGLEVLRNTYPDANGTYATMRAVGLVAGEPSAADAGSSMAVLWPAFYDSVDRTIYRLDGTTTLFQAALIRAMALALADQQIAWSEQLPALSDTQRIGFLAEVNAIAAGVLEARFSEEPEFETGVTTERQTRVAASGSPVGVVATVASDWDSAAELIDGPIAAALAAVTVPSSDAAVLDPLVAAATAPVPVSTSTGGSNPMRTLGVQFWASVLSRLGPDAARSAALLWAGDASSVSTTGDHPCISARIVTRDAAGQAALAAALTQWAQSRGPSASTTVTVEPELAIAVSACEAAEAERGVDGTTAAPAMALAAANERYVLRQAATAELPDTPEAKACAVAAYRSGAIPRLETGEVDPAATEAIKNVVTLCTAAPAATGTGTAEATAPTVLAEPSPPVFTPDSVP